METVRIATRKSALALWQAEYVRDCLLAAHSGINVELVPMSTQGDKILDTPLAKIGGKGLFIKELEVAMLEGRADIAVHSMKDVPAVLPDGFCIATICERHSPYDAFVSNRYTQLADLPSGAVVGTSSLRRHCQLKHHRPDLVFKDLRGNVNTRLAKLDDDQYDGIILAEAGLRRLGFDQRIRHTLDADYCLPAVGQGAVGIESKEDDAALRDILAPLHHIDTARCVLAERAMNHALEGGCQVPIAGFAQLQGSEIRLEGRVGQINGGTLLQANGAGGQPESLGRDVAQQLIEQGADKLLAELK